MKPLPFSPRLSLSRRLSPSFFLVALACALPAGQARAETYATCAGFITSVPAVITTQGVWCMNQDLASNTSSGQLVDIQTNNVTIDCNGFKLGGLAAGLSTATRGIWSENRSNITVRNCNIRGFQTGIASAGSSYGHFVHDNRLDGNTAFGISLSGTGHTARGNVIVDTGGGTTSDQSIGIWVVGDADIIDNTIDGVYPRSAGAVSGSAGIVAVLSQSAVIRGNRIRDIDGGTGAAYGIGTLSTFISIIDNDVSNGGGAGSVAGVLCSTDEMFSDNRIYGFATGHSGCDDDGGNFVKF